MKKLPVIHQSEVTECGLACIAMISNYHGHDFTLSDLRGKHPVSSKGCTLDHIVDLFGELGFDSRPLSLELNELNELQLPCVIHWDMKHFVVLSKVTGKSIVIHDPAVGQKTIPLKEASKHFTGIALEVSKSNSFEPIKTEKRPALNMLWSKITGLKGIITQLVLLSFLLQFLVIALPYYMQISIDDVVPSSDSSLLGAIAIGFGLLVLFQAMISLLRGKISIHLGSQLNYQMTNNLFSHLLRLPIDYFQKRHIGDILSRFTSTQAIKDFFTRGMVESFIDAMLSICLVAIMFFYSTKMTLIVLTAIAIYFIARQVFFLKLKGMNQEFIHEKAKLDSNFIETLRGMQTIKLFGNESPRFTKWQDHNAKTINKNIDISIFQNRMNTFYMVLFGLENILVIYVAILSIIENQFTAGMLLAFIAYKAQLVATASSLSDKLIQYKMLDLHLTRIGDIVMTDQESINEGSKIISGNGISIKAESLSYSYSPSDPHVFKELNIEIKQGEHVAIVGPSGSGKSTLLKILLGLIEPTSGNVYLNDKPIKSFSKSSYRYLVSTVMQDDVLMQGSIAQNICFFDDNPDYQRIADMSAIAGVFNEIEAMPMKFETLVGDMGSNLSGGQKQRILIARALYKRPAAIFMDEATSHLDIAAEAHINAKIADLNITRVVVAHRQETINSAKRVIELK